MFEKFKTKATNFGQKALVKMGQAEEFKEDEDFQKRVTNFKETRLEYQDLLIVGKKMIEAEQAALAARTAYFDRVLLLASKQPAVDPRVTQYMQALKSYEQYQDDLIKAQAKDIVDGVDDFQKLLIEPTRVKKNSLSDLRTSRDAAERDKVSKANTDAVKAQKAANEWKRIDDQYQADRADLLANLDFIEAKKNHDLLLFTSQFFEQQYTMHATTYSDMARTEPEVQQAIQTLPALPARPGKDNTVTAPPAGPAPTGAEIAKPSAPPTE
ncbi:MAG: hypothetical protein EZS28_008525 [Streblomastix strix]|uniref:BAR domain-containing protein n=1 Tax=Streblomastix strix TaxID=222440 RepID=A0A5J4WLV2_9EUKA|nr:MAG: hypothetical protein EZS28_008525 [Streblomastix strix]